MPHNRNRGRNRGDKGDRKYGAGDVRARKESVARGRDQMADCIFCSAGGFNHRGLDMDQKQIREIIIRPTLKLLGMWSQSAEDLLLGTACQESHCGRYIRQVGCSGTTGAFGVWQMELATANDIYNNFLVHRPDIKKKVDGLRGAAQSMSDALAGNLPFACAMARLLYYRCPGVVPATLAGQAAYWKKYYNTVHGKGTEAEYIANWNRFVV